MIKWFECDKTNDVSTVIQIDFIACFLFQLVEKSCLKLTKITVSYFFCGSVFDASFTGYNLMPQSAYFQKAYIRTLY